MSAPLSSHAQARFTFIDALRGIAALGVVLFHLEAPGSTAESFRQIFSGFLYDIFQHGLYGVQVFFVLSGFVIAHALRGNPLTTGSIGQFILRRHVRLDIPYWAAFCVLLLSRHAKSIFLAAEAAPPPGGREILLNLFYLNRFLGFLPSMLAVQWTLCLEIQFYLFFVLLLALGFRIARGAEAGRPSPVSIALTLLTGLISMGMMFWHDFPEWFSSHWYHFVAGGACYWVLTGVLSQRIFLAYLASFAGATLLAYFHPPVTDFPWPSLATGFLTVLLIYLVGLKGHLTAALNDRSLQYLGRISYSLYLTHIIVLGWVRRLAEHVGFSTPATALFWFCFSIFTCLCAAHIFHLLVERPSIHLATRIKELFPVGHSRRVEPGESGFASESVDE